MKKVTVIFLAVIFTLGSFEICTAANASNLFKLLRTASNAKFIKNVKNASDGYDIVKMGAALIQSDTSELELLGIVPKTILSITPGTEIRDMQKTWQAFFSRRVQSSDYEEWYYLNDSFQATVQNGIVKVVACERENFATKRGIKIGSTLQSVVNAYGTNYDTVALNDYYDAYIFSVKIEGNIVDRVSNFLQSKESKIGRIIFIISRQNPQVLGLATALMD
mgnify:CR=1 FL=1